MARSESDREDLLREATALTERAEWRVTGRPETVVVGFRRTGSFSVYFGSDPVFQFDPEQRLRRAFVGSRLFRSQGSTLAELEKVRTPGSTELRRVDLSATGLQQFLSEVTKRLESLRAALVDGHVTVVGQFPADLDLAARVGQYLEKLLEKPLRLAPALKS